jgi:hypothetical protein
LPFLSAFFVLRGSCKTPRKRGDAQESKRRLNLASRVANQLVQDCIALEADRFYSPGYAVNEPRRLFEVLLVNVVIVIIITIVIATFTIAVTVLVVDVKYLFAPFAREVIFLITAVAYPFVTIVPDHFVLFITLVAIPALVDIEPILAALAKILRVVSHTVWLAGLMRVANVNLVEVILVECIATPFAGVKFVEKAIVTEDPVIRGEMNIVKVEFPATFRAFLRFVRLFDGFTRFFSSFVCFHDFHPFAILLKLALQIARGPVNIGMAEVHVIDAPDAIQDTVAIVFRGSSRLLGFEPPLFPFIERMVGYRPARVANVDLGNVLVDGPRREYSTRDRRTRGLVKPRHVETMHSIPVKQHPAIPARFPKPIKASLANMYVANGLRFGLENDMLAIVANHVIVIETRTTKGSTITPENLVIRELVTANLALGSRDVDDHPALLYLVRGVFIVIINHALAERYHSLVHSGRIIQKTLECPESLVTAIALVKDFLLVKINDKNVIEPAERFMAAPACQYVLADKIYDIFVKAGHIFTKSSIFPFFRTSM